MTRRQLLARASLGAFAVLAPLPHASAHASASRARAEAAARALGLDSLAAETIGRAWLERRPRDRVPAWLLGASTSELRSARRRDFATGRVAVLDRWILSETEARVCALLAVSAAPRG